MIKGRRIPQISRRSAVLIVSDRSNTGTISINGDDSSVITGVIYSPDGSVSYSGNFSGIAGCTMIVAQTISFQGDANFSDNWSTYRMDQVEVGCVVRLSA